MHECVCVCVCVCVCNINGHKSWKKKYHAALVITDLKDGGHETPAEAPTSQSLHATYCFFNLWTRNTSDEGDSSSTIFWRVEM